MKDETIYTRVERTVYDALQRLSDKTDEGNLSRTVRRAILEYIEIHKKEGKK